MTRLNIVCPQCARVIAVEVPTIDSLRTQLAAMTAERDGWRAKAVAADSLLKRARENPFATMFRGLS